MKITKIISKWFIMMSLQKCRVLVKCVCDNVHLISEKDDHRAAEELCPIYRPEHSRTFSFATLSNKSVFDLKLSEARKTGMEK